MRDYWSGIHVMYKTNGYVPWSIVENCTAKAYSRKGDKNKKTETGNKVIIRWIFLMVELLEGVVPISGVQIVTTEMYFG